MSFKHNLLLGTALSGLGFLPFDANAAAQPPIFTWTGFYAGVSVGAGWSNLKQSFSYVDPYGTVPSFISPYTASQIFPSSLGGSKTGFAGGAQIGYNSQVDNFLFGLEVDITGLSEKSSGQFTLTGSGISTSTSISYSVSVSTSVSTSFSASYAPTSSVSNVTATQYISSTIGSTTYVAPQTVYFPTTIPTSSFVSNVSVGTQTVVVGTRSISVASFQTTVTNSFGVLGVGRATVDWVSTIRGRIGFAADRAFIYATGGLALGGITQSTTDTFYVNGNKTDVLHGSKSTTKAGYAVGAGVEYAFTSQWSARVQYIYYNLGDAKYTVQSQSGSGIYGTAKQKIDGSILTFGINYKFGS